MTTEATASTTPIQSNPSAYIVIPFLGEAFAAREDRARGRSFIDTDADMKERERSAGLTVFIGRWVVCLDAPARMRRAGKAPAIWYLAALPVLLLASVSKALLRL
jgi:hypothetical protein